MKIILATPPKAEHDEYERFYPNLGLLYLITYARQFVTDAEFLYLEGKEFGIRDYVDLILKYDPDIFGLSFATFQAPIAYKAINIIKKVAPSLPIICGGPHPTAAPYDVLRKSKADICVMGEGEITFTELLKTFKETSGIDNPAIRRIDGLAIRNGDGVFFTKPRSFISDLDSIPFPAWDLVDFSKYSGYHWKKASRDIAILSSRGCPYKCVFCANSVWKSSKPWLRLRSPTNVANEIKMLYDDYDVREIFDFADEFNSSLNYAIKTCKQIKGLKLENFFFKCQLRADRITDELADGLRDIGCWLAQIGIESGNQETLDGVKKHITLEQVIRGCRKLKERGIKVLGFFMIFNIWERSGKLYYEDRAMCENTFKFAKKLLSERLIDYMSWSIATPIPGSEMFELCRKYSLLAQEEYCYSGLDHVPLKLPCVSERDVKRIKAKGTILQGYSSLLSGNLNWKNLPYVTKKVKLIIQDLLS